MAELLDLRNKQQSGNYSSDEIGNFRVPESEETEPEIIAWTAPEIHHHLISHGLRKFIVILLFSLALLALIWQRSFLTAITFASIGFVTSFHFRKDPEYGEYLIHSKGVVVNDRLHEYPYLESFCIHHEPDGIKEISLYNKKRLIPHIKIPLGDQDPEEVRALLSMYLLEDFHEHGPDDYLRIRLGL